MYQGLMAERVCSCSISTDCAPLSAEFMIFVAAFSDDSVNISVAQAVFRSIGVNGYTGSIDA